MMLARVAGVPSPLSFIASESSFSSRVFPAVSMAVKSVPSVKTLGRPGLLAHGLDVGHILKLSFAQARRQGLRVRLGDDIEHLPAGLLHGGAGGTVAIDDRLAGSVVRQWP